MSALGQVGLLGKAAPIACGHPLYVLLEASGPHAGVAANLERTLDEALQHDLVTDAVLAKSGAEIAQLWELRDRSVEVTRLLWPAVSFDVSVPITQMESFVVELESATHDIDARCQTLVYGHLGDGNLHVSVHQPPDRPDAGEAIERAVYGLVGARRGSISAEHGIGITKREFLPYSRTPQEIASMRTLKDALDPKHILNRGRVLEHQLR